MKIPIFQVDAFAGEVFKGNPAAVCPLERWPDDNLMQKIAAENNLSETAFFVKKDDGFHIRWFTPVIEVDLCGHATLATAAIIFEKFDYKLDTVLFHSRSGMLTVRREEGNYILNFPTDKIEEAELSPEMRQAIGQAPQKAFRGREDYLLIYENEKQVRDLAPDFRELFALSQRGIIASAPGTDCDFVSRFFAPAAGIDEDPVTGSAHTTLIPYWSGVLKKKELSARQISSRGGELSCLLKGDRVEIGGRVVFYLEGLIDVPENTG